VIIGGAACVFSSWFRKVKCLIQIKKRGVFWYFLEASVRNLRPNPSRRGRLHQIRSLIGKIGSF
jgi:hypothetical protein